MRIGLLLLFCALVSPAHAQQETITRVKISSGTGFVINNDGHVITNAHVVRDCESISVLTNNGEEAAELVEASADQDLAVLKTHYVPRETAPLRFNIAELRVGDPVVLMGYPGEAGARGTQTYRTSRIISLRGPSGEPQWLQLDSVAAKGNSGGPVLDGSGNVIAVLTGIAKTFRADRDGQPQGEALGQSDIAITLGTLQRFLHAHGISYYQSPSGLVQHSDQRLHESAGNFTVPVRCVLGYEVVG